VASSTCTETVRAVNLCGQHHRNGVGAILLKSDLLCALFEAVSCHGGCTDLGTIRPDNHFDPLHGVPEQAPDHIARLHGEEARGDFGFCQAERHGGSAQVRGTRFTDRDSGDGDDKFLERDTTVAVTAVAASGSETRQAKWKG
jgi:hypothetical protein